MPDFIKTGLNTLADYSLDLADRYLAHRRYLFGKLLFDFLHGHLASSQSWYFLRQLFFEWCHNLTLKFVHLLLQNIKFFPADPIRILRHLVSRDRLFDELFKLFVHLPNFLTKCINTSVLQ